VFLSNYLRLPSISNFILSSSDKAFIHLISSASILLTWLIFRNLRMHVQSLSLVEGS